MQKANVVRTCTSPGDKEDEITEIKNNENICLLIIYKQYILKCDAFVFVYAASRLIIIPKDMGINVANKFAFNLFHLYNNVRTAMHLISKTNHVT